MTTPANDKPVIRVRAGSSLNDGLMNVIQGAGSAADKQQYARYQMTYLDQYQIEASYSTSGLSRKIHDLVPYEMTREWRNWQADETDTEGLEAEERRLGLRDLIRDVEIAARLYGGAVLVMGLPGRFHMPAPKEVGKGALKFVIAASRHQVNLGPIERNPLSENYGKPEFYEINQVRIHPSRVIPVVRQKKPIGALSGTNDFWGDPLLQSLEMQLKNTDAGQQNIAALLGEAKIDTITIPGLTSQLATAEYESLLSKRLSVASMFQSIFNIRLIDGAVGATGGGEKWETRQLSFAGLPDVQRAFNVALAAVADIPYTRLFGESPGGLQTSGKNEQRDFERMIRSKQNVELRPVLDRLDEYLIPSALGSTPDDVYWSFAPLSTMDEVEASEVDKRVAETMKIYVDASIIPTEVATEITKNRMIESGRFPGAETAFASAAAELEIEPLDEGEDDAVSDTILSDAEPRSLYVQRKLKNSSEFLAWARSQGFKATTPADDLHVTVLYSRDAVDWMKMGESWNNNEKGEITVQPGGARLVEALGDKGAVVLLFNSSELSWRHRSMIELGASHDYPDYQPHVTITYEGGDVDLSKVEPYRGKLVFGPEIFEELNTDWSPGDA